MKSKKFKIEEDRPSMVEESAPVYLIKKHSPTIEGFTFNDFRRISAKVDFTQKEWSDILHISERSIQRYSHNNGAFNIGVIDRIIQINNVLQRGQEVFGSYEKFNLWLRGNPYMLEGQLSIFSLASIDGINKVLTQIGRIEHGILA
jgi:putative toxin-antitoxin system antitoxin component (TIGR02293 family)